MQQDLSYRTYGRQADVALLLIHPLGNDLRFWEECAEAWAPRYFCIVPDLRSAGQSPRSNVPVGVDRHVDDLEQLLAALGLRAVIPIGCAIGALVAGAYAARHPERTRALVMANPGVRNSEKTKSLLRERVERVRANGMAALLPDAADRAFLNMPHDERYQRYAARYRAQDPERFMQSVLGIVDIDIGADIPRIACPTLVVAGEHDALMPSDSAAVIAEMLPSAEIVVMRDVAHFLPFQAPERFVPMVTRFLDGVRAA